MATKAAAVPTAAQKRAAELREAIEKHDHNYYVLDAPTVADAEYDALYRELEALENTYPSLVTPDSPTQRVGGAPLPEFAPVRHTVPMLSIRTETDIEAVLKEQLGASCAIILVSHDALQAERLGAERRTMRDRRLGPPG